MYRILTVRSKRDDYASLYQYLVETTEEGQVRPVEFATKEELDAGVEYLLNNLGYAKSDFIVVNYIDYTIDAKDYSDDDTESDDGAYVVYDVEGVNTAFEDDDVAIVRLGSDISSSQDRVIVLNNAGEKTLDLAGHSIICDCNDATATDVTIYVRGGSTLNIVDNIGGSVIDGGQHARYNIVVDVVENSVCNIYDGVFTCGAASADAASTTLYAEQGAINVYDGYFETRDWDDNDKNCVLNIVNNSGSTITCYGGMFADQNPADGDDRDTATGSTFVAEGYTVEEHYDDDQKIYVVVKEAK